MRIKKDNIKPISDGEIINISPREKERLVKRVKKKSKKFFGGTTDEKFKKHIHRK